MEKSHKAIRRCARWLEHMMSIGWPKAALDELEKIWWKYHDPQTGEFKP